LKLGFAELRGLAEILVVLDQPGYPLALVVRQL